MMRPLEPFLLPGLAPGEFTLYSLQGAVSSLNHVFKLLLQEQ